MKGFSLIELILVLALVAIVSALTIPFVQSFQVSADLTTYSANIALTLQRAQQQAMAGQDDSSWGVYFDNSSRQFILFRGDSFAGRDQTYDQVTSYPEIFSLGTDFGSEISFAIFSGEPSASSTVTITSRNDGTKKIFINSLGLIQVRS